MQQTSYPPTSKRGIDNPRTLEPTNKIILQLLVFWLKVSMEWYGSNG